VSGAIFIVLFRCISGGAIDSGSVPYVDFLVFGDTVIVRVVYGFAFSWILVCIGLVAGTPRPPRASRCCLP
jgi:uncharacterized membrane protein